MAANAQAFDSVFYLADINTRTPIESAAIVVNGNLTQYLNSTSTDSLGFSNMSINESSTYYTASFTKLGYHTQYLNYTWTADNSQSVYMYPVSDDGIVRLKLHDMTLSVRAYCILYDNNGRLEGCYNQNDTVQLLVNQNYTVVPELTLIDIIASEASVKKNIMLFGGLFTAAMVLVFICAIPVALFMKIFRKRR